MLARSVLVAIAVLGLTACPEKESKPVGVTPIKELTAAGKAPIQFVSAMRRMVDVPGAGPVFDATFKNISDQPVSAFMAKIVLLDEAGKPCATPESEGGYSDISPIKAGETVKLSLMVPDPATVSIKVVMKDLLYEVPNPLGKDMGTLSMKWKNANFEAELAKAKVSP